MRSGIKVYYSSSRTDRFGQASSSEVSYVQWRNAPTGPHLIVATIDQFLSILHDDVGLWDALEE